MGQDRLKALSLLAVESELLRIIDFSEVIEEYLLSPRAEKENSVKQGKFVF